MNWLTRLFATPLRRELAWALLIKMAALGLIGWAFFSAPKPVQTVKSVSTHLLQKHSPDIVPTASNGEPHGIGNRR